MKIKEEFGETKIKTRKNTRISKNTPKYLRDTEMIVKGTLTTQSILTPASDLCSLNNWAGLFDIYFVDVGIFVI